MHSISIKTIPGIDEWREHARLLLANNIPPDHIIWQGDDNAQMNLLASDMPVFSVDKQINFKISAQILDMINTALCHNGPCRFDLCYRLLWRLKHENKNLLALKTDNDVLAFQKLVKAVRRDAYKITAFLRFREVEKDGYPYFIAWYEPEFFSLELKLDFFKTRFKNMRWSILTPYRAAHWNGENLFLEDNPDPALYPKDDKIEQYWLTYYASIFNPARPKKNAMMSSMPKKYWKNMPESILINNLLKNSQAQAKAMIARDQASRQKSDEI
tara:strand:+ start:4529 stop:5341 length:813 start_codon:yes stop_codon:yes gene_type:complete